MAKSNLVKVNKMIAEKVVGGYKKIEKGAVDGFHKISDKFIDNYLTKDGETVADAKARLDTEQKARVESQAKQRAVEAENRQNIERKADRKL